MKILKITLMDRIFFLYKQDKKGKMFPSKRRSARWVKLFGYDALGMGAGGYGLAIAAGRLKMIAYYIR